MYRKPQLFAEVERTLRDVGSALPKDRAELAAATVLEQSARAIHDVADTIIDNDVETTSHYEALLKRHLDEVARLMAAAGWLEPDARKMALESIATQFTLVEEARKQLD